MKKLHWILWEPVQEECKYGAANKLRWQTWKPYYAIMVSNLSNGNLCHTLGSILCACVFLSNARGPIWHFEKSSCVQWYSKPQIIKTVPTWMSGFIASIVLFDCLAVVDLRAQMWYIHGNYHKLKNIFFLFCKGVIVDIFRNSTVSSRIVFCRRQRFMTSEVAAEGLFC